MQPQPAQNMYVPATGTQGTGNTVRNQQQQQQPPPQVSTLYHGPSTQAPPPTQAVNARGDVTSRMTTRVPTHVPTHVTYQQPPIHQGVVLPAYPQYQPRQTPYHGQQFFQPPMQPNYYPNYYFSTIQQAPPPPSHAAQAHARAAVSNGLSNSVPSAPVAGQTPLQLPAGAVLASPVGAGTVLGAPSAGQTAAGQVNVSPLVGVGVNMAVGVGVGLPTTQPPQPTSTQTRRPRIHALKIIDPNTNKNILEDFNLPTRSSTSSALELQDPSAVANDAIQQQPRQQLVTNGGVAILETAPNTLTPAYNLDVDVSASAQQIPHQTTQQQTVLPTIQKPRNKKILPIVAPKDDSPEKTSLQQSKEKISQAKVNTETKISSTAQTVIEEPQLQQQQKQQQQPQQQQQQEEKEQQSPKDTNKLEQQKVAEAANVAKQNMQQPIQQQQKQDETQAPVLSAPPTQQQQVEIVESAIVIETENVKQAHETISTESQVVNIEEKSVTKDDGKKEKTITPIPATAKTTDICIESKTPTVAAEKVQSFANHLNDEVDRAVHVPVIAEIVTVNPIKEKTNLPVDRYQQVVVSAPQEALRTDTKPVTEAETVQEPSTEAVNGIEDVTAVPTKSPAAAPAPVKSLITYNEGQWSPHNPTGKRQYDREQLLQLREAKASRIQPTVSNNSILPQPSLMPSFMRNNNSNSGNHKRVNSVMEVIGGGRARGGGADGGYGKQASMPGVHGRNSMKNNVIRVNLSLDQDVKLSETDNAWKPRSIKNTEEIADPEVRKQNEKDDLIRRVRGILNKLTPEKFDALVGEILKLKIDTPDKMEDVMVLVFEKAIDEPNFSVSYARLCHRLIAEVKTRDERMESGTKSNLAHFRNALIDKTEREFTQNVIQTAAKEEKLQPIVEKIKNCKDPVEKAELEALLEEEERKIRRRSGGTVRFIGELFKISMLTAKIINACIDALLVPDNEDMLECLCKLLTTVGNKFENTPVKDNRCYSLEKQIARMQAISSKSDKDGAKVSSRVRFMLQDVIDLRKNKWQSKHNEAPKTMQQIEKETKTEQMSAQYLNYGSSLGGSGGGGSMSHSGYNKRDDRGGVGGSSGGRGGYGDSRSSGVYGGSHSQRGGNDNMRRQQQQNNNNNNGIGGNSGANNLNNNNDDSNWLVQTKNGRSLPVDTNKLGAMLNKTLDIDNKKMGGVSQFQWSTQKSASSAAATTTATNSFAALSSLTDSSNKFGGERDRDRGGRNNKGSYNKGSVERERYGVNSRSGSTQASRENSSSRGSQSVRSGGSSIGGMSGTGSSSAMSKSASHSKYTPQNMPSARIPAKNVPSGGFGSSNNNMGRPGSTYGYANRTALPPPAAAVFEEPSSSDLKLIKVVVSEIIENAANAKAINSSVVNCFNRIAEKQRCGFLYFILTDYLHLQDVNHMSRRQLALCVIYLINNYLSMEHFRLAYENFCELANDLIVDIPELWLYVFEFIGPFLVKKLLTLKDLWSNKLIEIAPPNLGQKFLKTFLTYCTREIGPTFTRNMWQEQQLKWNDFMPESEVEKFVQSNKFEYIENEHIPLQLKKDNSEKHIGRVMERIERLLLENSTADEIIDYINGNIDEADKHFIQRLTTVICNFCVSNPTYKLELVRFQKIGIPILQRYIDSKEELELECLYAMQLLVHNWEHPRDLLSELFGELYDADVIPQNSFIRWRDHKDQSAGKGVAVKGLNPFFNHVLTGETSDENN